MALDFAQIIEIENRVGQIIDSPKSEDSRPCETESFLESWISRTRKRTIGESSSYQLSIYANRRLNLPLFQMGITRHERVQKEIAHYRELGRTVQ
jgi:hypothetical protein